MIVIFNKETRHYTLKNMSQSLWKQSLCLCLMFLLTSQVYAESLASVNGIPVSSQRYYEHYQLLQKTHPHAQGKAKLEQRLAKRALLPLVKELILRQEAQRLGFDLMTLKVSDPMKDLRQKHKTAESLAQYLLKVGETESSLRLKHWMNEATYQLMKASGVLSVSREEIQKEYTRQMAVFKQPEKTKAYQILLKLPESASAEQINQGFKRIQDLHKQLLTGTEFSILVQRHSEGALRSRNGDMGFVKRGDLVQSVEDVLWQLKEGEFSIPVRSRYGWHIIKRGANIAASQKSFDQVKNFLADGLRQAKYRKQRRSFVKGLWAKAQIDSSLSLRY